MQPEFIPHSGQLSAVWLDAVEFQHNEGFDPDADSAVYSLNVDHKVLASDDPGDMAFIEVYLDVGWTTAEPSPFNLSMTASASFRWAEERPVETRRGWTEYNGVYLVWPYMRAWIATITGFSPLTTFTLPTLAVPRPEPWTYDTGEHTLLDEEQPVDELGTSPPGA